jgi:aminoglycoside phosphotransferase (APT) family kinase protein
MCTIGDPLLDLGNLLGTWPIGPDPGAEAPETTAAFGGVGGGIADLPTPAELVARYAAHADRDTAAVPWYTAMACFKLGIVLEGTYARACAGKAPKLTGDLLHATTLGLFARAHTVIAKG